MKLEINSLNTQIENLGQPTIDSPLSKHEFLSDSDCILFDIFSQSVIPKITSGESVALLQRAGPRSKIYFNPVDTTVAIITCGGLCPGINNVIRALVMELSYVYGVQQILGIRNGYQGFSDELWNESVVNLSTDDVLNIDHFGGSFLNCSRGRPDLETIVSRLRQLNVQILFVIGGDGTLKGARSLIEIIRNRSMDLSVIGIPKTIDNDINFLSKSFGFETAVSEVTRSINAANAEATSIKNGIGLIKVMGRYSGFVAACSALGLKEVNFVLIPEMDFDLYGDHGLLSCLQQRIQSRSHAVIVVAEGAGQKFFKNETITYDASGNAQLFDITLFLKNAIHNHFKKTSLNVNIKLIDPSYMLRSVRANPMDSVFCGFLAQNAVHAAMAGKTNMIIGHWNNCFVYLPIDLVLIGQRKVSLKSELWNGVLETTGQPTLIN